MMTAEHHLRVWLDAETLDDMASEGQRLERNLSWLVREAWTRARGEIRGLAPDGEPHARSYSRMRVAGRRSA